jgi:hypothetical protein
MHLLLDKLDASAEQFLPRRKQRALVQMRLVVQRYATDVRYTRHSERAEHVSRLVHALESRKVDHDDLADAWLFAIRSRWRALVASPRRRKRGVYTLDDLTNDLKDSPLSDQVLQQLQAKIRQASPLEERIFAGIIGVPR